MITSTAYIAGALPESNATWFGFGATPAELRASGLVAAIDKITREKAGVMVLGLPLQMKFNVYTTALDETVEASFKFTNAWLLREGRIAKAVDAKMVLATSIVEKVDPALVKWRPA